MTLDWGGKYYLESEFLGGGISMTEEEFWAALEETAKIPGRRFRLLGGFWRRESDGMCPIGALCWDRTGQWYSNNAYEKAADLLGLSPMFAYEIAQAADGKYLTSVRERLERIFAREDQEHDRFSE